MTVQMISLRKRRVDAAPPPATVAQQGCAQAQDLTLAVRLRAVYSGWSYLGALEFFELTQAELIGRLDSLCRGLQPRYAQPTLATKSGAWFADGECSQHIARLCRSPTAGEHVEKLEMQLKRERSGPIEVRWKLMLPTRWRRGYSGRARCSRPYVRRSFRAVGRRFLFLLCFWPLANPVAGMTPNGAGR